MKAFTLIEILVTLLILSVIIMGIYLVLNVGNMSCTQEMQLLGLEQQARTAMGRMLGELRNADGDTAIAAGSAAITFTTPTSPYTPGGLPGTGITYARNNNILRRISPWEAAAFQNQILGNNITALTFSKNGDMIIIDLVASNTVNGRTVSFPARGTFRGEVSPRNE